MIQSLIEQHELEYNEKNVLFAKAIVQECINSIQHWKDSNPPFSFDEDAAMLLIRKTFGYYESIDS